MKNEDTAIWDIRKSYKKDTPIAQILKHKCILKTNPSKIEGMGELRNHSDMESMEYMG